MMEDIINLIMTNGMGVTLMAYFLFKDWKFNEHNLKILNEIREVLIELRSK